METGPAAETGPARSQPQPSCDQPEMACCGVPARRPSVTEFIDRGLRRRRQAMLPTVGAAREDEDGRTAQFSLELRGNVVAAVRFQSSPCITLIAYCELLAEEVSGVSLQDAAPRALPQALVGALPGVPPYKRGLAHLASAAWFSAVRQAIEGEAR